MVEPDTTIEAHEVQMAAYRAMSGVERLRVAFVLSEDAQRLRRAGQALREPPAPTA